MGKASRIVIVGCGYVGTELGERLLQRGHHVWGVGRSATREGRIRRIIADVRDPASLQNLPTDLDFAVYAVSPVRSDDGAYAEVFVHGIRNVVNALRDTSPGLRRFLFLSSTAVYGQIRGELVDEESPTEPLSFRGTRLLQGEAVVRSAQFPTTVLRVGGLYGPGRARLLRRVRRGEAKCSQPDRYTNRIHRDDCATAVQQLLQRDEGDALYLGVDDAPVPRCEVLRWLAAQVHVPPPPVVPDETALQRGNKRCSNKKLRRSGVDLAFPTYQEGYRELLRTPGAAFQPDDTLLTHDTSPIDPNPSTER